VVKVDQTLGKGRWKEVLFSFSKKLDYVNISLKKDVQRGGRGKSPKMEKKQL